MQVASIPMDRDHMQTLAEWMGSIDGEDLEGTHLQKRRTVTKKRGGRAVMIRAKHAVHIDLRCS